MCFTTDAMCQLWRRIALTLPDARFAHPRLAAIYDAIEPERPDLNAYLNLVSEVGARTVLDVGCGTGTFACMLALRGHEVTAADPAEASLAIARTKPGAEKVRWISGDASARCRHCRWM